MRRRGVGNGQQNEVATGPPAFVVDPTTRTVAGVLSSRAVSIELGLRDWRVLEALRRTGEPALVVDAEFKNLAKAWIIVCKVDQRPIVVAALAEQLAHLVVDLSHVGLRFNDAEQAALVQTLDGYALPGWGVDAEGLHARTLIDTVDDVLAIVRPVVQEYVRTHEPK